MYHRHHLRPPSLCESRQGEALQVASDIYNAEKPKKPTKLSDRLRNLKIKLAKNQGASNFLEGVRLPVLAIHNKPKSTLRTKIIIWLQQQPLLQMFFLIISRISTGITGDVLAMSYPEDLEVESFSSKIDSTC